MALDYDDAGRDQREDVLRIQSDDVHAPPRSQSAAATALAAVWADRRKLLRSLILGENMVQRAVARTYRFRRQPKR